MKRTIVTIGFISLAAVLFSSCIYIDGDPAYYQNFNYSLRGTWVTQPSSFYDATVVIDYNTIRITGTYRPAPLNGFTPNSLLNGYTEETYDKYDLKEGLIYINDGIWKEPIQYRYWVTAYPESAKRLTLLPANITLFYKQP
ncbi:MAG: hypothetical protein FWG46_08965 [Treponema sp.]|nr:hypothetical protein [Treponema sp.]